HGIFQASLQEGIRAANPALARMLGYENPAEALWHLTDLSHHLFIGGEAELEQIRHTLKTQQGLFGYDTRLRRKDGTAIDVIMNLLLKPDEDGLVEGFVADITDRKLAQMRLLQLNEQLEQRVTERTLELRKARDAAEAANHSKDKYLAAASHDLLQPLNAARLLISTLRERRLPDAETNLVERAHQALEGAEDLLTDLLDISKLDQQAIKPDIDVYRLDEVLLPLVSEFQSVADAAGLGFDHYIPAYALRSDFRLLTRILRNFLSNACRYTDHGRVLLGARKRG
ncbi:MAG TPA: hybrid sensor histidine kinase/response regulator, partial [Pseudomonas sp.]|nr:hybrid sensor histidine kinase/response regulator [Pseudomonas sp.]